MEIRPYRDDDEAHVAALWREVFPLAAPHHDPVLSIRRKLAVERELFLVYEADGVVVGAVMGGYDGHRGWIYSLAVHPEYQRRGIGRVLMERMESLLRERDCVKVNLQIEMDNADVIKFYEKLGFGVEERVSMGKRLYE